MIKKNFTFFAACLSLGFLSACQTTTEESEVTYTQITTETAFIGGVVGKPLFLDSKVKGTVIISADKTWSGEVGPMKMKGTWEWKDGYWCRTLEGSPDDCQKYEMSSRYDAVRVSRDKGNGKVWIYKIGAKQ